MITDEDLIEVHGLPPEQQFAILEKRCRTRLEQSEDYASEIENYRGYDDLDYMMAVLAIAKECGIEELAAWNLPSQSNEDRYAICKNFRAEATLMSHRLLFRYGQGNTTVGLDAKTKQKLSLWIAKIRETVQAADIADEKKDRLFDLINRLQREIDQDRTRVQAAGELFVTVCSYVSEGARKLDDAIRAIERISGAIGIAQRDEKANPKLPPRKEPKRLEPPQKAATFDDISDSEIPF